MAKSLQYHRFPWLFIIVWLVLFVFVFSSQIYPEIERHLPQLLQYQAQILSVLAIVISLLIGAKIGGYFERRRVAAKAEAGRYASLR
jgi:hypothetical protein